jgi:hypothetical protein
MPNYQKGKIYKIYSYINPEKCYIGSTCQTLEKRFNSHKYPQQLRSKTSLWILFEEYGIENCCIELIENYACNNLYELLRREGYYIQKLDCVNKIVAGRTKEEYSKTEQYKQKKSEWNKNYRQGHKEELKEKGRIRNVKRSLSTEIFKCECCNYETNRKDSLVRHYKSGRHKEKALLI